MKEPMKTQLSAEHIAQAFQTRMDFSTKWADRVADFMTQSFGTTWFFVTNVAVFVLWFLANNGFLGITPFDPFPYNFLTMVVSLEAIFLAIIVLMSQNRASRVADIRQKIDLEIDVRSEQEITKIINLIERLHGHLGVSIHKDAELKQMEKRTDLDALRREAESN